MIRLTTRARAVVVDDASPSRATAPPPPRPPALSLAAARPQVGIVLVIKCGADPNAPSWSSRVNFAYQWDSTFLIVFGVLVIRKCAPTPARARC